MRKIFDAAIDIIILAVLVFTVLTTVDDVLWRYILTIAGCGAMFNNCKYLYNEKKKTKKKNNKKKENK
jgi:hypothetical protein